jgi:hypothetical protein
MRAVGFGLLLSLLLSLVLTPLVGRLALWLRALDPFSARKLLRPSQVPRLGGVAIAVAFYLTVATLWSSGSVVARATLQTGTPVLSILLGGVPILLLGIVDDLRGLRALPKLLVEIVVALLLYTQGLRVLGTSGPTGPIELSQLSVGAGDGGVDRGRRQCRESDRRARWIGLGRRGDRARNDDGGGAVAWRLAAGFSGGLPGWGDAGFSPLQLQSGLDFYGRRGKLVFGLPAGNDIDLVGTQGSNGRVGRVSGGGARVTSARHGTYDFAAVFGGATGAPSRSRPCAPSTVADGATSSAGSPAAVCGVSGVRGTVAADGARRLAAVADRSAHVDWFCAAARLLVRISAERTAWTVGGADSAAADPATVGSN